MLYFRSETEKEAGQKSYIHTKRTNWRQHCRNGSHVGEVAELDTRTIFSSYKRRCGLRMFSGMHIPIASFNTAAYHSGKNVWMRLMKTGGMSKSLELQIGLTGVTGNTKPARVRTPGWRVRTELPSSEMTTATLSTLLR